MAIQHKSICGNKSYATFFALPQVVEGDPFYYCHTCVSVAGIHPKKNLERFPINNVGNDGEDGYQSASVVFRVCEPFLVFSLFSLSPFILKTAVGIWILPRKSPRPLGNYVG